MKIMLLFFIQTTPESADTPEADISDLGVIYNMGDDILE